VHYERSSLHVSAPAMGHGGSWRTVLNLRTGPRNLKQPLLFTKDRPKGTAAKRPEIRGYSTRTFLKLTH